MSVRTTPADDEQVGILDITLYGERWDHLCNVLNLSLIHIFILTEEGENSSDISFDSSEVSFDSSEVFFLSSVANRK